MTRILDVLLPVLVALRGATDGHLPSLARAREALAAEDPEEAEQSLASVLEDKASAGEEARIEASLLLASARLQLADPEGALAALDSAAPLSSARAEVRELRAEALLAAGKTVEAEEILLELSKKGTSAAAEHRLGTILFERGEHRAALARFEKAMLLDSNDYYSAVYAARARLELADAEAARRGLLELAARADTPEVHYLLGKAAALARRWDEAVTEYRRALTAEPDYLECTFALAGALRAQGKEEEARAAFARFRVLQAADWRRLRRGKEIEQACALRPGEARLWSEGARFQLDTGDVEAARTFAWRALRVDPGFHQARLILARALRRSGRYAAAAVQLRRILRAAPEHAEAEAELRDLVAKHAQG
jgi:tetratricopeptide (TPR) repeat protein